MSKRPDALEVKQRDRCVTLGPSPRASGAAAFFVGPEYERFSALPAPLLQTYTAGSLSNRKSHVSDPQLTMVPLLRKIIKLSSDS